MSAFLTELDEYLRMSGVEPHFQVPQRRHRKHARAIDYRDRLEPEIWDKTFKFTVVRNPYALMVSCWHWWVQKAPHLGNGSFRPLAERVRRLGSFSRFLEDDLGRRYLNNWTGNPEDWFLDEEGRDLVDFIVKQEELDRLPVELVKRVPVPGGIRIPHFNRTEHDDFRTYYDDRGRRLVEQRFSYILERFGYRYD
ncbi:MAG: hypothetical protein KatS3mg124_0473 [Porticoccaceae bacterium]|nr:MAG: hypothetical protein KatS3mg124_0473 [Porticoccaceae bacterium]